MQSRRRRGEMRNGRDINESKDTNTLTCFTEYNPYGIVAVLVKTVYAG